MTAEYIDLHNRLLTIEYQSDTHGPRISVQAEVPNTFGFIAVWLAPKYAERLAAALVEGRAFGFSDPMGDTLTVLPTDTFTVIDLQRSSGDDGPELVQVIVPNDDMPQVAGAVRDALAEAVAA